METITDGVREVISRELNNPLERLTPDTALQDIGVTSLDFTFIIFALEEKFNISIPYNANDGITADERAPSKAGFGELGSIVQISAAVKVLIDNQA
jgi:acyl carrier protein